jgi:hypothetical protein
LKTGLPDGIFAYQNANFGTLWKALGRKYLGILHGNMVYFMVLWYISWHFGIFHGTLVYFMVLWYISWYFGFCFFGIFCFFGLLYQEKFGNPA